jgi:hypothetical protein
MWKTSNNIISEAINEYQDIYRIENDAHVCKVKMKIIQEMIQIERPRGWNMDRINLISRGIKQIELYNKHNKIKNNAR